jgi:hypothetical protein
MLNIRATSDAKRTRVRTSALTATFLAFFELVATRATATVEVESTAEFILMSSIGDDMI